jgi:hypothetical protein
MKITILPSDQAVYKDGVSYLGLTLNSVPTNVHALQWDNNAGHIEYKNHVKPNETISALPQWANDAVVVWQQAYDAEEAAKLAAEEEAKLTADQPTTTGTQTI